MLTSAVFALLPWMAGAVSGSLLLGTPVVLDYADGLSRDDIPALRIGDECFIPAAEIVKIQWRAHVKGENAKVEAHGRSVETFSKKIEGKDHIPVRTVVEGLGGGTKWSNDGKKLSVYGKVQSIKVTDGMIEVISSLPSSFKVFTLSSPERVVVDMKNALLDANSLKNKQGEFRFSQFDSDTVRVVAQIFAKPQEIKHSLVGTKVYVTWKNAKVVKPTPLTTNPGSAPTGGNTAVNTPPLVMKAPELVTASEDEVILCVPISSGNATRFRPIREANNVYRIDVFNAMWEEGAEIERISGGALISCELSRSSQNVPNIKLEVKRPMAITITPTPTELRMRLTRPKNSSGLISEKLFVIDAGHGGSDPGAQYKDANETLNEKDFNLDVAKRIAQGLSDAGAAVIMTREDDTFIELHARPEIANKAVSHFFISVHFNSNVVANSASGTMTFYHRDDPDARTLAECIHAEIAAVTGLPDLGVRSDTTIYQNGFAVLRHSKMPAVLLEIAFINNAVDREAMKNPEFLQRVADAVVKGIRVYLGES